MTHHREDWQKDYASRMIDVAAADVCQGVMNALNPRMPNHKFPKLKKRKTMKTSAKFFKARIRDGKLLLPGSKRRGGVRFDSIPMAEDVRFSGKIVDYCTVSLENDAWYVCFTVRLNDADRELVLSRRGHDVDRSDLPVIGVDVNIRHFDFNLTSLERGGDYSQVRTLTDELLGQYERVNYYNRSLARKRVKNPGHWKTSKSYRRTRIKLGKIYRRIYALQDEIIDGFVRLLRDRASVVVIEDLDTSKMFMNKSLCKSLQRALFGRFKTRVQQAMVGSGVRLVMADRYYPSTQRCSSCGFVKTGEDRLGLAGDSHGNGHDDYVCYECGSCLKRDENAVANLVAYGKAVVTGSSLPTLYKIR